jgi:uncharacterized membrane protein YadS
VHVFILIPFYFFSAIGLFLILTLLARVLRLQVTANALAISAVVLGLSVVAVPLLTDVLDLAHYGGRYLLLLGAITFALAALDTLLEPLLPLPLDRELEKI